jgi:hypothetical protein
MTLALFLAKLMGIYMLIVFLLMTARKEAMIQGIKGLIENPVLFMFSGSLNLLGGLAIIFAPSLWVWGWPLIIVLLGLLMIIRGICQFGFTSLVLKQVNTLITNENYWKWSQITVLILGLILSFLGFVA